MTVWSGLVVPVPLFALPRRRRPRGGRERTSAHRRGDHGSTLYTAYLCSLFGYGVWNTLLARYPTASVVPFTLLVPVSGIATAWVFRGERPTLGTAMGGLLLLGCSSPPSRDAGRRVERDTTSVEPGGERDGLVSKPQEAFTG